MPTAWGLKNRWNKKFHPRSQGVKRAKMSCDWLKICCFAINAFSASITKVPRADAQKMKNETQRRPYFTNNVWDDFFGGCFRNDHLYILISMQETGRA